MKYATMGYSSGPHQTGRRRCVASQTISRTIEGRAALLVTAPVARADASCRILPASHEERSFEDRHRFAQALEARASFAARIG